MQAQTILLPKERIAYKRKIKSILEVVDEDEFGENVTEIDITSIYGDGRNAAKPFEILAQYIRLCVNGDYVRFIKSVNENEEGFDGILTRNKEKVNCRAFTSSGIYFCKARRIGADRTCTLEQAVEDIKVSAWYLITDIRNNPTIYYYLIESKFILEEVLRTKKWKWDQDGFISFIKKLNYKVLMH